MINIQDRVLRRPGHQTALSLPLRRVAKGLINGVLITSLGMAILVFAIGAIPALLSFKTMVVSSGSMEPSIRVGDAVWIKSVAPESIQVDDVITFATAGAQGTNTHRVTAIKEIRGQTYFQTKGDANTVPDFDLTPADAVYGKVSLTLPKAGYLLHYSRTPWGFMFMIGLPLLILVGKEVGGLISRTRPASPAPTRRLEEVAPNAA